MVREGEHVVKVCKSGFAQIRTSSVWKFGMIFCGLGRHVRSSNDKMPDITGKAYADHSFYQPKGDHYKGTFTATDTCWSSIS